MKLEGSSLMYLFIVNVQQWVQMKEQLVSGSLDSSSDSSTERLSMTKWNYQNISFPQTYHPNL